MDSSEELLRVLVIGAGSAGLLIAQGLRKLGIPCTVFEQDATPHARQRDWNFGIYWAQTPLGQCLPDEINCVIETAQVDSHTPAADDIMPIYNGDTGLLLKAVPAPYSLRLQRRKFLKLISTGIDIRYGRRLAHIDSDGKTVTATFEDGSRETGNLLVGAEGAHSKVRDYLLGKEKAALILSPIVASAVVTSLPAEVALSFRKLHPRYCVMFHPNGYFCWLGVHDCRDLEQPESWTFMFILSWVSDGPTGLSGSDILKNLKERAEPFAEPFRSIIQSIPDGTMAWHNRLSLWPTQPWDNRGGTVTLAGDAAHPMTFHRGQGLNNSIHDAAYLLQQLQAMKSRSSDALSAAVSAYEEELWQRGKEAVLTSNENSLAIHDWSKLQQSPLFTSGLKQKVAT
ncbi:MAG: hypothetical protein M1830_009514 [Pleopsidium flavum]|nr:MAG: hypothetical protein M1830_009514 [Pleopsidium flavum]